MNNNQTPEEALSIFSAALQEAVTSLNEINASLRELNNLIAFKTM